MMFGLAFAWIVMKLAKRIYQHRMLTAANINQIWDRNYKIRHAVEAIPPVPYPAHQQAIRVIRDEVDRIVEQKSLRNDESLTRPFDRPRFPGKQRNLSGCAVVEVCSHHFRSVRKPRKVVLP